jgi:hypothetical protein
MAAEIGRYGKVFCLEGDWDHELTARSSVRPMLELLEGLRLIEFVHKDVGTRAELRHYLDLWAEEDESVADFHTLYLAFHGTEKESATGWERAIWLSDADDGSVSLRELADILGPELSNVVLHFGSCSVLDEEDELLAGFCRQTGIRAVAGYTTDVDFVESAAMDMLFFTSIAGYTKWSAAKSALDGHNGLHSLRESLGFRIFAP